MRMVSQPGKHNAVASSRSGTPRVIVAGAGIGGLVTALELASQGLDVQVLERADSPGGKLREISIDGAAMDAGPTVFTMRWVFDEFFDSIGLQLSDYLALQPMHMLARHAWSDSERLDLFADIERSADAIGTFAGAKAARGYRDFCERSARIYRTLEQPFLRSSRPSPVSLATRVGVRGMPDLMRISPLATMWSELGRHFDDPRLKQLFGRYATYCGSSPFSAPATLMLVAHVEQEGVWMVDGGMRKVATTLATLASKRGARMRFGAEVRDILVNSGRACGVRLTSGEELQADAVVFNGDVAALSSGFVGLNAKGAVAAPTARNRSLSALTWNLLAPTSGFPLSRHTVFFSNDYQREFEDVFGHRRLPTAPTVYVCAQDRNDDDSAGVVGAERMLLIVNAPATGDGRAFTATEIEICEEQTFKLMARCGLQIQRTPANTVLTTPKDFERLFPATGGALYGQASHGWMASFNRPGSRSKLRGLYLAGGSTHPGPGVPMAALSGRQAAASVIEDLVKTSAARPRSTATLRTADTPGGISTL